MNVRVSNKLNFLHKPNYYILMSAHSIHGRIAEKKASTFNSIRMKIYKFHFSSCTLFFRCSSCRICFMPFSLPSSRSFALALRHCSKLKCEKNLICDDGKSHFIGAELMNFHFFHLSLVRMKFMSFCVVINFLSALAHTHTHTCKFHHPCFWSLKFQFQMLLLPPLLVLCRKLKFNQLQLFCTAAAAPPQESGQRKKWEEV
jgi:hypothetical protein